MKIKLKRREINKEDANDYIKKLINEILRNPNKKQYAYTSEKTEVVSIVLDSVKNKSINDENSDLIANRLLNKEVLRQKEVNQLDVDIKRGCLIQSLVKEEDFYYYIITKVENIDILDINDLFRKSGLPYENKSFKNCLFKLDEDANISQIFLSDKNGPIADYWDNLFLELKELTNDETNTVNTFEFVKNKIKREIEKISPSDYTLYRNQALGYFKTKEKFTIDDFLDYTFGTQSPESTELNISKIKSDISNQMKTKGLDTEFKIVPSAIKSRKLKETKKVNDVVTVVINGYDEEIKKNIKSKSENGDNYLMIKATDIDTFNRFKWENNN